MTNPYTIITIGPIYDTFMLADKTRAFWGASTLFSAITNKILYKIWDAHKDNIVVPRVKEKEFLRTKHKAGLLDDRIIMKGKYADILKDAYEGAIEEIIAYIIDSLKVTSSKHDTFTPLEHNELKEAEAYFREYFHSYIIEVDVPSGENPILFISPFADSAEYQPRIGSYLGKQYMRHYFDRVNRNSIKKDIFTGEEIANMAKDRRFKSTMEIAAAELIVGWDKADEYFYQYKDIDDTEVYEALKSDFDKELKSYHRYYALVKSDGDGFGAYLKKIGGDREKLKALSNNLFAYLEESVAYIREKSGGMVVYAGGDDLLFFAPVIYEGQNIFGLSAELDKIFRKHFAETKDESYKHLSISYGMSIAHYKYPLYESLEIAHSQLFDVAKNTKWKSGTKKNALALNLRKHSGGTNSMVLHKSTNAYKNYIELVKNELDENDNTALPHGFYKKIQKFKTKFQNAQASVQIDNFFDNEFGLEKDTTAHGAKIAIQECREILKNMLFDVEDCIQKEGSSNASDILFAMLKTTKMLRGDE